MNNIVIAVLALVCLAWGDSFISKNRAANKLYQEKKYDQALAKYRDAQIDEPQSNEVRFNVGNTLYKTKKYPVAMEEYQMALRTEEADLQAKAYYNMGNCQYRMGKLGEAIESYKEALELNSDDMDAKYNLEFVRRKLKEMAQKSPQQQKQQQKAGGDKKQKKQQAGKSGEKEEKGEKKEQQAGSKEGMEKKKMPEEDARRILDALKDEEKDLQRRRQIQFPAEARVEKDW